MSADVHVLAVVSAGLTVGGPSSSRRLADRLAERTIAHLARDGADTALRNVELRDHAMDIARAMLQGFASETLENVMESVSAADAAIFVTPVFSASYSGLFKSFIDVLEPDALANLPVLIAATGGTERHSLALEFAVRPLFAYLRAVALPTGVFASTGDWGAAGGTTERGLAERVDQAAGELAAALAGSVRRSAAPVMSVARS